MPLLECTLIEKKNRSRKIASPESKKRNKRKIASPESKRSNTNTPQSEGRKSTDTCDSSNASYTDSRSMIPTDESNSDILEVSLHVAKPLPSSDEELSKSQNVIISSSEQTTPSDSTTSADFIDNNQEKVSCFQMVSFVDRV